MPRGDIITQKHKGRWINVVQGSYSTQEEAAAQGRVIARRLGVEWFLRARSGRWRIRNTYGHDPRRTKN